MNSLGHIATVIFFFLRGSLIGPGSALLSVDAAYFLDAKEGAAVARLRP